MSIEAMKQALEALESIRPQNMTPLIHPAKTTLRTAIHATELREQAEKQEPVAYKPPAKWTDAEIKDGYRGIRWVTADGVYGRPTEEDVARYLGYTRPAAQPAPATELRKQQFDHTAAANAALRDAQNRSYKIARTAQQKQEPVAKVVPCHTPSGKRVALNTKFQHLPIGTDLCTTPHAEGNK
jgi:hypothetical protein